jgi:hypothetical protein
MTQTPTNTTTNTLTPTNTPTMTQTPTNTTTNTLTPTKTVTPTITSTPTQTPPITLYSGLVSTFSDVLDGCFLLLDQTVYISNVAGISPNYTISVSSIIYTDSGGGTPFVGDGDFYRTQIDGSGVTTSSRINGSGNVTGPISIC